jgi:hypothetical protein
VSEHHPSFFRKRWIRPRADNKHIRKRRSRQFKSSGCNNNYYAHKMLLAKLGHKQTATEDSRDAKTQPENYTDSRV